MIETMQGKGMRADDFDDLLEREALQSFDDADVMWLVVRNDALEDLDESTQMYAFSKEDVAVRIAQALSHGNVDHRVLGVTKQLLVRATHGS